MRFAVTALTLTIALGLAACANNPNRPTDTGSMALPAPRPTGVVGTSRPGVDTGSANPGLTALPNSTIRAQPEGFTNQGSMQLPSSTQGNLPR
jgi:hypothetical protein